MFKVTWLQMSQCVGESLRKKNCHIAETITALPHASFHPSGETRFHNSDETLCTKLFLFADTHTKPHGLTATIKIRGEAENSPASGKKGRKGRTV